MSVPLRIVTLLGGLMFVALAAGLVLPPLNDVFSDPNPVDGPGGSFTVVLMVLFIGAAPAFVGTRLILRAVRGDQPAAATVPLDAAPAIAEPVSSPFSPDSALPPPPSERRAQMDEAAAATAMSEGTPARTWSARLGAIVRTPLGLALALAAVTMPLMILLRPAGAYIGTLALMVYSIVVIGMSTVHKSWWYSVFMSGGTGMMLFIVLAMTAGALEQGEGNNPVFVVPGLLFYGGIGLTGVARLFNRR